MVSIVPCVADALNTILTPSSTSDIYFITSISINVSSCVVTSKSIAIGGSFTESTIIIIVAFENEPSISVIVYIIVSIPLKFAVGVYLNSVPMGIVILPFIG